MQHPVLSSIHPTAHPAPPNPCQALTWNSGSLDQYLAEATQMVKELDGLLAGIKAAVAASEAILQRWQRDVMFERKEGRVARYEELSAAMRDLIAARHAAVAGGSGRGCAGSVGGALVAWWPARTWACAHSDLHPYPAPAIHLPAEGGKSIAEHLAALARQLAADTSSPAWRRCEPGRLGGAEGAMGKGRVRWHDAAGAVPR